MSKYPACIVTQRFTYFIFLYFISERLRNWENKTTIDVVVVVFFTETKSACQTDPQRSRGSVNHSLKFSVILLSSSHFLSPFPVFCPHFLFYPQLPFYCPLFFLVSLCAHHIFLSCSLPLSLWGNISKLKIHNHSLKTVPRPSAVYPSSLLGERPQKKRKILSQVAWLFCLCFQELHQ